MAGTLELHFPIQGGDFRRAGEASSRIKKILGQLALPAELVRRVAIAAYEMEMNIVIHAYHGVLHLRVNQEGIEVEAGDEGPGIPDVELAMQEGYSTAPPEVREMGFGAGMGLSNIKRCADVFTIETVVGKGTTVRAQINHKQG